MFFQRTDVFIHTVKDFLLSEFLAPRDKVYGVFESYAEGGKGLGDVSDGLVGYIWHGWYKDGSFYLQREGQAAQKIFDVDLSDNNKVFWFDFCFDQGMNPFIIYGKGNSTGNKFFRYYVNSESSLVEEVEFPAYVAFPRCMFDTRDIVLVPQADVIIAYMDKRTKGRMCYALQRERFLQDHEVSIDPTKSMVWRVGHDKIGRVIFHWR